MMTYIDLPTSLWNCGLHPLIYTLLDFTIAQDMVSIKNGAEAPQCSLKNEWLRGRIINEPA
jgi:hypothetical protein